MKAFSLVELSIVLVILGLLTGGILSGQSLIRAAELRSITGDLQRYQAAVHSFRDRYMAIPGDMSNATKFWGAAHATASTCLTSTGTGTQTCDGNGNGSIATAAAPTQYAEIFTFWQHLANAGLIEGTYTGRAGATNIADHDFGTNAPPSRIGSAGWGASWTNNSGNAQVSIWRLNYNNWMTLGTDDGAWADDPTGVMRGEEVWNIDTKMDDGRPGTGRIHTYGVVNCTDQSTNANHQAAEYLMTAANCTTIFNYLN